MSVSVGMSVSVSAGCRAPLLQRTRHHHHHEREHVGGVRVPGEVPQEAGEGGDLLQYLLHNEDLHYEGFSYILAALGMPQPSRSSFMRQEKEFLEKDINAVRAQISRNREKLHKALREDHRKW